MRVLGLTLGIIALVVGAFVLGLNIGQGEVQPVSYWMIDDHTVGVFVEAGPSDTCGLLPYESGSEVRLTVRCRGPLLSAGSSAVGYPRYFEVPIITVVGSRSIVDGSGNDATKCASRCIP